MQLEVLQRKENPLLKRVEVTFKATHKAEPTPTRDALRAFLAKELKATNDIVVIEPEVKKEAAPKPEKPTPTPRAEKAEKPAAPPKPDAPKAEPKPETKPEKAAPKEERKPGAKEEKKPAEKKEEKKDEKKAEKKPEGKKKEAK